MNDADPVHPDQPMVTLFGVIDKRTEKAIFFQRYETKEPLWYPLSNVQSCRVREDGSAELEVTKWIYDKKRVEEVADPTFFKPPAVKQQEMPFEPQPEAKPQVRFGQYGGESGQTVGDPENLTACMHLMDSLPLEDLLDAQHALTTLINRKVRELKRSK